MGKCQSVRVCVIPASAITVSRQVCMCMFDHIKHLFMLISVLLHKLLFTKVPAAQAVIEYGLGLITDTNNGSTSHCSDLNLFEKA